jgi:hypothetical protein
MKDRNDPEADDMLPEYDFESMEMHRGRTYERLQLLANNRVLAPDLAAEFQDSEAVNEALREYLRLKRESA